MLHLVPKSQSPEEIVLEAHGWISGENVPLLECEGESWKRQTRHLVLDMTEVRSIDRAGAALLMRWAAEGLTLQGGSAFVRELLREHGLEVE